MSITQYIHLSCISHVALEFSTATVQPRNTINHGQLTILFQALMRQKRSEMIDRSITGSDRPNGPNSSIFGSTSQFGNSEMGGPNFDDEEMVRDRPSTVPRNVLSENIGHQMGHYFPFEASF